MPSSPEVQHRIIEAINAKVPVIICPVCQKQTWNLADGSVRLILTDHGVTGIVIGGPVLPSIALVCTTCGNTLLFNIYALGLGDLVTERQLQDFDDPSGVVPSEDSETTR